jgi:hypothetical protein
VEAAEAGGGGFSGGGGHAGGGGGPAMSGGGHAAIGDGDGRSGPSIGGGHMAGRDFGGHGGPNVADGDPLPVATSIIGVSEATVTSVTDERHQWIGIATTIMGSATARHGHFVGGVWV